MAIILYFVLSIADAPSWLTFTVGFFAVVEVLWYGFLLIATIVAYIFERNN